MKKKIAFLITIILVCSLFMSACGNQPANTPAANDPAENAPASNEPAAAPSEETITLKFSYNMAENSFYGVTYGYFAEKVAELTNGTVQIEMYPSSTLVSDAEFLDALMMGNVDMGHFYITSITPTIKELTPLEIPGIYPAEDYDALKEATFDIVDSIYNDYGVKFIAMSYPDTCAIAMTDRIVHGPADLKGATTRAAGTYISKAFELWGASATTIPIGDTSTALERGTVDGIYTGWMMVESFKFDETAPYVTFTGMQNGYYGIIINDDVWNRLSADQQAAMLEAGELFSDYSKEIYDGQKQGYLDKLTETGAEYYFMTDEENDALRELSLTQVEGIKDLVGEKGLQLIEALEAMRNN